MAGIFQNLKEYREFKDNPVRSGVLHGSLSSIKRKVLVPVPSTNSPSDRWKILKFLVQLAWSGRAIGSVITGTFFSILTYFAEQPAHLLRMIVDDSDIQVHIVEVYPGPDNTIKFTSRGLDLKEQENRYKLMADAGPEMGASPDPFVDDRTLQSEIKTTDELQIAIASITAQIWVLLTKAVTAPDTAKESENKRWIKFLQQKRVDKRYQFKAAWTDIVRDEIARDVSIRKLMVAILIEIGKSAGPRGRILDLIMDVGNYVAEAGMAAFHLTIKYGIETRLPVLALNELQSDLNTMSNLMQLYKEQGAKAPYLVLIEDSIQNKFAPGNFPLLWSLAMGIGVTIDRQMSGLNFNRSFLEPSFFRLGQDAILKMEGNVDRKMAADMGLTDEQIRELKMLVKDDSGNQPGFVPKARISGYTSTDTVHSDDDDDDDHPSGGAAALEDTRTISSTQERRRSRRSETPDDDFKTKYEKMTRALIEKYSSPSASTGAIPKTKPKPVPPAQGSDKDVMESV